MRLVALFAVCLGSLSLAGCQGAFDPFQRPGTWSATGASRENIALQAANKGDLISGQSQPGSNGVAAVAGIQRAMPNGAAATGLQVQLKPATTTTGTQ